MPLWIRFTIRITAVWMVQTSLPFRSLESGDLKSWLITAAQVEEAEGTGERDGRLVCLEHDRR